MARAWVSSVLPPYWPAPAPWRETDRPNSVTSTGFPPPLSSATKTIRVGIAVRKVGPFGGVVVGVMGVHVEDVEVQPAGNGRVSRDRDGDSRMFAMDQVAELDPQIQGRLRSDLADVRRHRLIHDQIGDHAVVLPGVGEDALRRLQVPLHDLGIAKILIGLVRFRRRSSGRMPAPV